MGELILMNLSGDVKIKWNPADPDDVRAARRRFEEARKEGFVGYSVTPEGEADRVVHEFDPTLHRINMRYGYVGG